MNKQFLVHLTGKILNPMRGHVFLVSSFIMASSGFAFNFHFWILHCPLSDNIHTKPNSSSSCLSSVKSSFCLQPYVQDSLLPTPSPFIMQIQSLSCRDISNLHAQQEATPEDETSTHIPQILSSLDRISFTKKREKRKVVLLITCLTQENKLSNRKEEK